MTKQNNKKILWSELKNNILKIVTNPKKGTVKVYDKKGKIILKKSNLTIEQIKNFEESFINSIIKKLNEVNNKHKQEEKYDPMVV